MKNIAKENLSLISKMIIIAGIRLQTIIGFCRRSEESFLKFNYSHNVYSIYFVHYDVHSFLLSWRLLNIPEKRLVILMKLDELPKYILQQKLSNL